MSIEKYTPCRMHECFLDQNNEICIANNNNTVCLKGIGRTIWHMLDGKHTIEYIVDKVCQELGVADRKLIQEELITILKMLSNRKLIVVNWDPIYKYELSQDLNI